VPTQSVLTGHTATQPALTLAQRALTAPRPIMSAMYDFTHTAPELVMPVTDCVPTMPMQPVTDGAPTLPGPAMPVHALHECTPAMSMHTMSVCVPTAPMHTMSDCVHAMSKPTWPVNECTRITPRPTAFGLLECTHTVSATSYSSVPMHVVSQSTVSGPVLPTSKP